MTPNQPQTPILQPSEKTKGSGDLRRRGGAVVWILALLVLTAIGGGVTYALSSKGKVDTVIKTHTASLGNLVISVVDDGNVESSKNVDLKCEIAGGSTILWIVEDGKVVKQGDVLVRLDSANLEDQTNQQKITYEKAQAAKIQAERDFASAKIAVQEYEEGTFVKELQLADSAITVAMETMRTAQNLLEHTQKMARKGLVNKLQLESQEFAVRRAQLDLDAAKTAKDVLERFTKAKMMEDLHSKRDAAEARMRSEQAAFQLEESKLKRLENQLQKCTVTAPQDGMVVWANDRSKGGFRGGSTEAQIEEGALVREQQSLIKLPDLVHMQVKVAIHETKIDRVKIGQKANIRIQGRTLIGTVSTVANQPESGNWMSPNIKEYATVVSIDQEQPNLADGKLQLKPGMTAEVEILVNQLHDVVTLPVQCVVERGGKYYAWLHSNPAQAPEKRELVLGDSDDKVIEVKDGILENDLVLLNPRAHIPEANQDTLTGNAVREGEVTAQYTPGQEKPAATPGAGASAGGAGGAGGGAGGGFNMMSFDKNGDKKLAKDELPEQMAPYFDKMDANADGFIDAPEVAKLRSQFRGPAGGGAPGAAGGGGAGAQGAPGGGAPGGPTSGTRPAA